MTKGVSTIRKIEDYPETLISKRKEIECNFVLSLWKRPDEIADYLKIKNGEDIITDDGMFYFGLATQMYKLGYRTFDNITTYTFLADKEVLRRGFDNRGGYATIAEITSLLDIDNIESYYDELVKNNSILGLYDNGFQVEKYMDKFQQMTSEDVYDFIDYKVNNIFIDKVEKLQPEDLSDGYEKYVDSWDKGTMRGFKVGYPILNYRLAGVHKENLLLHLAHIGNGKTTSSIIFYILPAIESGENVCIIANEQGVEEFRQMILSSVLFNKIGYHKINRQRFIQGGFTAEDREQIKAAQQWLKNQKGKILFIPTNDYSIRNVKKVIRKYSKVGYGLFVFDTLKPETESSDRAWAQFSEVSKELFLIAKKEKVAIIATAQLSSESMARKYLDLSCVGKSRAIAETATQVVMFRSMSDDEKQKLQVYRLHKDEQTGKYTNIRDEVPIDINKDYIILFTPKNRFGDVQPQIVYERNMAWNQLKEIGLTHISYDGYGK